MFFIKNVENWGIIISGLRLGLLFEFVWNLRVNLSIYNSLIPTHRQVQFFNCTPFTLFANISIKNLENWRITFSSFSNS